MAKFYGIIGYVIPVEVRPGVWDGEIVERSYYGDLTRNMINSQASGGVNDNINITNNISIVADPYATENFQYIKYVKFMGAKWKISNLEIQYPRIILTVGGVYNG